MKPKYLEVPLSNSRFTGRISEEDKDLLKYTWCDNGGGYIVSRIRGKRVYLHRAVAEARGDFLDGRAFPVEHLNHNKYDCTRNNLRTTSVSQNTRRTRRSGFVKNDSNGRWAYAGFIFKQKRYLIARTKCNNDLTILQQLAEVASHQLMKMQDENPNLTHDEVKQNFPMVTV
jgi:hypothetical protein